MNQNNLDHFKQWFSGYCKSFYSTHGEDQKNILLKEHHTLEVCRNIVRIAADQSLTRNDVMIAEAIGLFHDIGRFPQYAQYKTFRDSLSINHGELGARTLREKGVLGSLPADEQEVITTAVKFHNAFKIPDLKDQRVLLFLKLIRDADKLDIWRVFFEYYGKPAEERPSAAGIGLPDTPEYSPEVLARVFNKQLIELTMLRTLNDFKLTKLSWMYDLNFPTSLRMILENSYIERIAETLPQTEEIKKLIILLNEYVHERLKGDIHV